MTDTSEKKIVGSLSLEELLAAARKAEVAEAVWAGGDADTKQGWRRRLGVSQAGMMSLLSYLDDEIEEIRGMTTRNGAPYPVTLYRSATLLKYAEERA